MCTDAPRWSTTSIAEKGLSIGEPINRIRSGCGRYPDWEGVSLRERLFQRCVTYNRICPRMNFGSISKRQDVLRIARDRTLFRLVRPVRSTWDCAFCETIYWDQNLNPLQNYFKRLFADCNRINEN
eukprot:4538486-Pleurochrysis_carterae.AAC.1